MIFAEPENLWLLLCVPALVALYAWHWWWKAAVASRMGNTRSNLARSGRMQVL